MPVVTPQQIPDAAQPTPGVPGSRAFFFLRGTPKPFTVLTAGASNQDFQIAAVVPVERRQVALGSRRYQPRLPGGTEKASSSAVPLAVSIATAGTRTSVGNTLSVPLTVSIATSTEPATGAVSMGLLVDIFTNSSGGLSLTPEAGDGLTLTPEADDGLTLTSESSDSLDLTPET